MIESFWEGGTEKRLRRSTFEPIIKSLGDFSGNDPSELSDILYERVKMTGTKKDVDFKTKSIQYITTCLRIRQV